ncbi:hypothetical protein M0805_001650 [Coniferiporia weirii]|nr:hypothetical protein M0805_001650 [Coniferiporia weirii]
MHRHPFASVAVPPLPYGQSRDIIKARSLDRPNEKLSQSIPVRFPSTSTRANAKRATCYQERRPTHIITLPPRSGVTLTLNGQEEGATVPTYGRGGIVDGTISFINPASITKVEAKIEGHVTVSGLSSRVPIRTVVLSELLVYWDCPDHPMHDDRPGSASSSSPSLRCCPSDLNFRAVLPTHFTEIGGRLAQLPPSFSEVSTGFQEFTSEVTYSIRVVVTRVRDVGLKSLAARWKKDTVVSIPFEYRPRTRPAPSPLSKKEKRSTKLPGARFQASIRPNSPSEEPVKTLLYLPNSHVVPISAPIPFFLKISGPEGVVDAYSGPHLSSFLPRTASDSLVSFAGSIQHHIAGHLQSINPFRVLQLTNAPRPLSRASSQASSNSQERSSSDMQSKVRVTLVRSISVDVHPDAHRFTSQHGEDDWEQSHHQAQKYVILGEAVMHPTRTTRDSVTWAGEIRIDPRAGVKCGQFETKCLVVRDMLVVSIMEANLGVLHPREFQQIIPVQLTTDTLE